MLNTTTLHGVFLNVFDLGILLTGPSNVGKSELALDLIQKSHQLIADDMVELFLNTNNQIIGRCPVLLQDFLAIPSLGLINIRRLLGDQAMCEQKALALIIHLIEDVFDVAQNKLHLEGTLSTKSVLGHLIPYIEINLSTRCNLTSLIETIVLQQKLSQTGYNPAVEFTTRQQQFMANGQL